MALRSDVCLILEGTYPYVTGGVSSWVHQLVNSLSSLRFSLMIILPNEDYGKEMKYRLPSNIVEVSEVYIHDYEVHAPATRGDKRAAVATLGQFVREAQHQDFRLYHQALELLVGNPPVLSIHDILYGEDSWDLLQSFYEEAGLDISFIDFFWTFRFSLLPMLKTVTARIPRARIYHTIATGYAGLLATAAVYRNHGSALILTEHGIYAKERRIEISEANWIYDEFADSLRPDHQLAFFKRWWTEIFQLFSTLTYRYSDQIVTLYEGNRQAQIQDGADPDKCQVIPNGLDIAKYHTDKRRLPPSQRDRLVVSLVGRVVPIKDIHTFINACRILCAADPRIECWICGPTNEDPQYYGDCLIQTRLLGLEDRVVFKGKLNLVEHYPDMDVLVLTSVSEAMPLVILEAYCYGIPVVATDVGSCRELVEGRTEEDRYLGPAGRITGIANPEATAQAILDILGDDEFYLDCGKAGRERLLRYYQEQDMFAEYLNLYETYL